MSVVEEDWVISVGDVEVVTDDGWYVGRYVSHSEVTAAMRVSNSPLIRSSASPLVSGAV